MFHQPMLSQFKTQLAYFWSFLPILLLTIGLWHSPTQAVARGVFKPSLKNLRVMTVTKTDRPAQMDECQLAQKVFNRRMPKKAVIGIENSSYLFTKGVTKQVKKAHSIYLMSRGYARKRSITGSGKDDHFTYRGGCIIHTRDRIAQGIVHLHSNAVAVTFDYQDRYINFGQKRDISCLSFVYDKIKKANPTAHIIIVSECLGAKTALELAIKKQIENCTIVMESPFFTASDLFNSMVENYMGLPTFYPILDCFFRWFHHYDPRQDDLPDRLNQLPKHIKIFACHRNHDPLISDAHVQENMNLIIQHLGKDRVAFYRFTDTEKRHSSSFRWAGSQKAVNQFYQIHPLLT